MGEILENKYSEEEKKFYLDKYSENFKNNGYDIYFDKNFISIKGNDLFILGNSVNTFWTAEGVLCSKDYDFLSNDNFIMIDIGLNIGITSLFMSTKKNITHIYGFEPFENTFYQAKRNILNNKNFSDKIKIYKYGLGLKDEFLEISYNPELPGSMSTKINRYPDIEKKEKVEIKNTSNVLNEIFNKHSEKIFLKIDCEGAEFDIIEDLDNSGLLSLVDVLCLEWHFQKPDSIINILKNKNFIVFNSDTIKNELGFIRAVKN